MWLGVCAVRFFAHMSLTTIRLGLWGSESLAGLERNSQTERKRKNLREGRKTVRMKRSAKIRQERKNKQGSPEREMLRWDQNHFVTWTVKLSPHVVEATNTEE